MRVKILPPTLANQIAAGEVVERPASIVKELVENSLDAGASDIRVRTENGGMDCIEVGDDGGGIHPEDLPLILHRHATSKLNSIEDLSQLDSFGFRGEALPSIASVADVEVSAKFPNEEHAWKIVCPAGDEASSLQPSVLQKGTCVRVQHLFHNVPVRRKFLSSERSEHLRVLRTLYKIGLAHFNISFQLRHNGKLVLDLPVCETQEQDLQRIEKIMGVGFASSCKNFFFQKGDTTLSGWIGLPHISRTQSAYQYLYVNQRAINDKGISFCAKKVYEEQMGHGRIPGYLLYLSLPPEQVDINVHPAKSEVRFRNKNNIFWFVRNALNDAFASTISAKEGADRIDDVAQGLPNSQVQPVSPTLKEEASLSTESQGKMAAPPSRSQEEVRHEFNPEEVPAPSVSKHLPEGGELEEGKFGGKNPGTQELLKERRRSAPTQLSPLHKEPWETSPINQLPTLSKEHPPLQQPPLLPAKNEASTDIKLRIIGRLNARFIIAEDQEGLVLLDIPSLQKAIRWLKVSEICLRHPVKIQSLLIPMLLDVGTQGCQVFYRYKAHLKELGIGVVPSGKQSVLLEYLPAQLADSLHHRRFAQVLLERLSTIQQETQVSAGVCEALCDSAACEDDTLDDKTAVSQNMEVFEQCLTAAEGGREVLKKCLCVRLSYKQLDNMSKHGYGS